MFINSQTNYFLPWQIQTVGFNSGTLIILMTAKKVVCNQTQIPISTTSTMGSIEEKYLEENHWPGNPHNNENNEYGSLIVGPNAWLEVHADRDNLGETYLFEPSTKVYELSSIPRNEHGVNWSNFITSFRIDDHDSLRG